MSELREGVRECVALCIIIVLSDYRWLLDEKGQAVLLL
jgi:hypothetical protein